MENPATGTQAIPHGESAPGLPPCSPRPRGLASSDLLRGSRMVEIHHNGEIYRLQATRLGKLILTK